MIKEVIIKTIAIVVVNFDMKPPLPRSPNTVEEAPPPNAPARPSPLSACRRTTTIKPTHTRI
jgi:hypothetical protein